MAELVDGLWLEQFVEPQLLEDMRNYKDDFIGVLKSANPSAIDKDGIRFNKLINNIDFVVNATTDFTPKKIKGGKSFVEWDKLDTTPTSYTDAELRAMAFDKEAEIRVEHLNSFKIGIRDYVLNKLAPKKNVDGKMPVIRTTGEDFNGRKRLTYNDLADFLFNRLADINFRDPNGLYMILNAEHKADLIHDRANTNFYRDLEIDMETGALKRFFNLKFFENADAPIYAANGELKSMGAVKATGDQKASVLFYAPNTVYHIESTKVLFKDMKNDTRSKDPESEIRLHTYGLCDKRQEIGFGAIISANS
jgi:hypothetical protein